MKRILFIKEKPTADTTIINMLRFAGYDLTVETDGPAAVERALELLPDLILSGISVEGLDGFSILHLLRKNPDTLPIPFIFLTSRTGRADTRKAMEMGASDFISRPFIPAEVLNAIESRLSMAEKLKNAICEKYRSEMIFEQTFTEALEELLEKSLLDNFKRRQLIFMEGSVPQYLFYIKSGKVKAFKTSQDGKELIVGLYSGGDFMGYIGLLEEGVYRVSAQALEDSEIFIIPRDAFMELIRNNANFSLEFTRSLVEKNNYKADQMLQLAYHSLRKRVANAILFLKDKYTEGNNQSFSIKMTREELANISGTTTESLIRTLSDFKSEGLVEVRGRMIGILDEDGLVHMIN